MGSFILHGRGGQPSPRPWAVRAQFAAPPPVGGSDLCLRVTPPAAAPWHPSSCHSRCQLSAPTSRHRERRRFGHVWRCRGESGTRGRTTPPWMRMANCCWAFWSMNWPWPHSRLGPWLDHHHLAHLGGEGNQDADMLAALRDMECDLDVEAPPDRASTWCSGSPLASPQSSKAVQPPSSTPPGRRTGSPRVPTNTPLRTSATPGTRYQGSSHRKPGLGAHDPPVLPPPPSVDGGPDLFDVDLAHGGDGIPQTSVALDASGNRIRFTAQPTLGLLRVPLPCPWLELLGTRVQVIRHLPAGLQPAFSMALAGCLDRYTSLPTDQHLFCGPGAPETHPTHPLGTRPFLQGPPNFNDQRSSGDLHSG